MLAPLPLEQDAHWADAAQCPPSEAALGDFARLAALACDAPLALLLLGDGTRRWFRARAGLEAVQTPGDAAFCAGVPLLTPGGASLGTLSVMDLAARALTPPQREALQVLARLAAAHVQMGRDLRESARAEEALRESEARFQSIVAYTPGMVYQFVLHPDGSVCFPFVSDGCRDVYGLEPEAVQRDSRLVINTIPAEEQAEFAASVAESARTLRPWNWRRRIVRPDGEERWIQAASRPRRQDNGDVFWDGVVLDVTERMCAEEALREREAYLKRSNSVLKAQQEAAIDGILVVDEHRHIVGYNRRLCEMWNTPVEVIRSGDDQRHLAHALSLMAQPEEFLEKVLYLYDHPQESSRDELLLKDGRVLDRHSGPVVGEGGEDFGRVWHFRDITARVRGADALREGEASLRRSNSILRAQQEAAIDGILILDEHRQIVSHNRRFRELWGISEETARLGDAPVLASVVAQVQEPGEFLSKVEYLYAHPDESSRDELHLKDGRVLDRYSGPVRSEEGHNYGRVWYFRDVTDRVLAEGALRERTEILSTILSSVPQMIFWKDRDSVYLGGNASFARDAGLATEAEIAGKTDHEMPWTAGEAEAFRALDRRVVADGEVIVNEEQSLRRADGVVVTGLTSKLPLRDAEGEIIGVLGVYQDITERKAAEEALRASEERLRTVVSGLPLILFALDADAVITFSDGRGLNALGLAPGEDVGKSMLDLYDGYPDVQGAIRRALAGETVAIIQEFAGATFETQFVPQCDDGGRTLGVIGVAVDVTERRWAEQQILVLNGELEQRLDRIVVLNHELAQAYDATIEGWSRALDLRDHETEGHSLRVTDLTLRLAQAFGFPEEALTHVRRGALLHDIGKMGVPDAVLLKPGPLTDDERAVMQKHPAFALDMLTPVEFLRPALDIPFCHHEKWDGTGYPRGLAGEAIPLAARLFAVVDVWDALRSDRPYRRAWPVEKTRAHIAALAGTHFDPHVVDTFLSIVDAESGA